VGLGRRGLTRVEPGNNHQIFSNLAHNTHLVKGGLQQGPGRLGRVACDLDALPNAGHHRRLLLSLTRCQGCEDRERCHEGSHPGSDHD